MVELVHDLSAERIRANLERVRAAVDAAALRAGRDPAEVEILAATKYVPAEEMPALAEAGIRLVGENRAQDMDAKASLYGELFEWDFIGALQSRRLRQILPQVRMIHSIATASAMAELGRRLELARPGLEILIEVNVAREEGKSGVMPEDLDELIGLSPMPVSGLMAMPPLAEDPGASRPWFAAVRELARERGLGRLSMGTSQDYAVAVEEGATVVRIGTSLYA